jgi:hypothetical protein
LGLVLFLLGVVARTVAGRHGPCSIPTTTLVVALALFATALLSCIAPTASTELGLLRIAHA